MVFSLPMNLPNTSPKMSQTRQISRRKPNTEGFSLIALVVFVHREPRWSLFAQRALLGASALCLRVGLHVHFCVRCRVRFRVLYRFRFRPHFPVVFDSRFRAHSRATKTVVFVNMFYHVWPTLLPFSFSF